MAEQIDEVPRTDQPQGTSFLKTCFNGLNALSGIGVITIPYAVSKAGWLSLILLLLVAIITLYTGILLIKCMNSTDTPMKTYPEIGFSAFGRKGRIITAVFLYLELYLVPTGFLIMEADNLTRLFPHAGFSVRGHGIRGKPFFTIAAGIVILPSTWLNDLRLLSYISACGVLSTFVIIGSIVWVGFDGVGFSANGELFAWTGLPTALSLYAFCFAAHPLFPSLYSSMKHRGQFYKVLLVIFFLTTLTYIAVGVSGYLMFGKDAQSQVTINLPTSKISSKVAIYTTLAIPLVKYALIITPIANAIEKKLPSHWENMGICILIRTLLLLSTVAVALIFPYFGSLMELIGAVLNVTISILLPCICYLKIFKVYRGVEVVIIGVIIIMGVAVGVMGTYISIKERIG